MLPKPAKDAIRDAIPESLWFEVGEVFPDAPDASEWKLTPEIRWAYEDFENSNEPYDHVSLSIPTGGVIESNQPLDRYIGEEILSDDSIDADALVEQGQFVYDVLSIGAHCVGSETREGLTLTEDERAYALLRAIYRWFRHDWQTRPLDRFDQDGNTIADRDEQYADELTPPVRVDPIPGSGPVNMTESIESGAQYNAQVELHYVDSVIDYEFIPESADISIDTVNS
ncbi:hypothetical protein [Halocatena halophila]|uniref:hypothetical protein n=1 Tax=Halocatena halophila TaxID=2814576 RepID=UPI002ED5E1B3